MGTWVAIVSEFVVVQKNHRTSTNRQCNLSTWIVWLAQPEATMAHAPCAMAKTFGRFPMIHRRTLLTALSGLIYSSILPAQSPPSRKGIQAVGLANWIPSDVDLLVQAINSVRGRLEVLQLPFNFNPGAPFQNARSLIEDIRNTSNLDFTMTTCLDFRTSSSYPNGFDWGLFTAGRATDDQRERYLSNIGWLSRLDQYVSFVQRDRTRSSTAVIRHILVLVLEDDCPRDDNYSRLLNVVARYLSRRHNGFSTQYRRSCLPNNPFRVGALPLEQHGKTVPPNLRYGDVWSPDGETISGAAFKAQQAAALPRGISCLYWREELNGRDIYPGTVSPDRRPNLSPLSKNNRFIYNELLSCWR